MVKAIQAKECDFDYQYWKGKTPLPEHYDIVIDEPTDIFVGKKLVCAYRKMPSEILAVLNASTSQSKCAKSSRTLGVNQMSAVFGALPRVACREDYCRFSANTKSQPEIFFALSKVAKYLWQIYQDNFPEVSANFLSFVEGINDDWKKTGTPFTTINVNKNFAIGYHLDAANFGGVYSNVLITKKNVDGGLFVMPQFRLALAQSHGALVIVDGVKVPHGVTPIVPTSQDWERSSVVFYTLANLKHCLAKAEELKRSKVVATERARKRAKKIDPRHKG